MVRAVTGDHIMFNECIEAFRPENLRVNREKKQLIGYLLLDFDLNKELDFEHFTIAPSMRIPIDGVYAGLLAPVVLKETHEMNQPHLFIYALSAIISFVLGRSIKAPRNGYWIEERIMDVRELRDLAIQHPILSAGPGAYNPIIQESALRELHMDCQKLIIVLYDIPYKKYKELMQSIRLVHLALLNKREDFALGYYLLVSAIESFAETAIDRKKVKSRHVLEEEWKNIAIENEVVNRLFEEYKKMSGMNKYLGKRFVEFIIKYCPLDQWNKIKHPYDDMGLPSIDFSGTTSDCSYNNRGTQTYLQGQSEEEIRGILLDAYNHRSKFTHKGKNPPHLMPNSFHMFFDKQKHVKKVNDSDESVEIILPNFNLMTFLAKNSILSYIFQKHTK